MNDGSSQEMDTLAGTFLISTPRMPDPRFDEHVIYICAHNEEGAMGLAINRPNPALSLAEIIREAELPVPAFQLPAVHIGGPVELESAFILFRSGYETEHKLVISDTVSLTREIKVLEDIARGRGPEQFLFIIGYTGWGPGQLEGELRQNGWLNLPASDEIIFSLQDSMKWKAAAMQYGIDISTFEDVIGYA